MKRALASFLLLFVALPAIGDYAIEWSGKGDVRKQILWQDPQSNGLPAAPATYIFRVYPVEKTYPDHCFGTGSCSNCYWTTFFWGNNRQFSWYPSNDDNLCPDGSGSPRSYYGGHPYTPVGCPNPQKWEISANSQDILASSEVDWDRWHIQAFRVTNASPHDFRFFYDLPASPNAVPSLVANYPSVQYSSFGDLAAVPPFPALMMGQTGDVEQDTTHHYSWGCYDGWEEFSGRIRGIQIYSDDLSDADIAAEIITPLSTAAGIASIWYMNLDPRPTDITDKKGTGTAHHPLWDCRDVITDAVSLSSTCDNVTEWTDGSNPVPGSHGVGVQSVGVRIGP